MKKLVTRLTILSIIMVGVTLSIIKLYSTYATGEGQTPDETFAFNLTGTTTVTVDALSSRDVYYQTKNNNPGTVKYGVGYITSSNDVVVKAYGDTDDSYTGLIEEDATKTIRLKIINDSNESQTVELTTVLGYENGGALIVPSGTTMVSELILPANAAKMIKNLYLNNKDDDTIINNNIEYQTSSEVGLMNDRLGGTTSSFDGGNVRYYGADPNNYIYFNCNDYANQTSSTCEKWRIIGVFGDKVKIIRESIGNFSWDTSPSTINSGYGVNEWSQADLMKLLNPGYENNIDIRNTVSGGSDTGLVNNSLYWNKGSGTCYGNIENGAKSCNFTSTGLKNDDTKNRIAEASWNLGALTNGTISAAEAYTAERGTSHVTNPADGITRENTWLGKIAIVYPSDYGYATDLSSCTQETLSLYNNEQCKNSNWLILGASANIWTLTSINGSAYGGMIIRSYGDFNGGNSMRVANGFYAIRPTLFLTAGQQIVGGTGASDNPYRLAV